MARAELHVAPIGRRVAANIVDIVVLSVPWYVAAVASGGPSVGWWWALLAALALPGLAPGAFGGGFTVLVTLVALYRIVTDELARGFHDTLAGTRVIHER